MFANREDGDSPSFTWKEGLLSQDLLLGLAASELRLADVFLAAAEAAQHCPDGTIRANSLTRALSSYCQAVENVNDVPEPRRVILAAELENVRLRLQNAFQADS